jgi:hypothetical protein
MVVYSLLVLSLQRLPPFLDADFGLLLAALRIQLLVFDWTMLTRPPAASVRHCFPDFLSVSVVVEPTDPTRGAS